MSSSVVQGIAQLPDELWEAIARRLEPVDLVRVGVVSTGHRNMVRNVTCGVALSSLPRVCTQGELCSALALSPFEARSIPHTVERRKFKGGPCTYNTNVFDIRTYVPFLVSKMGGWPALKERLEVVETKKRKHLELRSRREEAALERVCKLDDWFASECPFGSAIDCVDSWIASLEARGAHKPDTDATLRAFLGAASLKGPPISAAKAAVLRFEAAQVERLEREELERVEPAARKDAVAALLRERGYELNENLEVGRVVRFERDKWRLFGETGDLVQAQIADLICEDIERTAELRQRTEALRVKEASRKALVDERRKALRSALRKRKLKRASDPSSYDAFVNDGRTKSGMTDVATIVDSMALFASRDAQWRAIGTLAMYALPSECDLHCRTSAMSTGGAAMAIDDVVRLLEERRVTKEAAKSACERDRLERTCTQPGCGNLHRRNSPAMGPNGPVCGACERM